MKLPVLLLVIVSLSNASAAEAPHWPGWLGPDRNGWVSNFKPPAAWPERLTKVWEAEVGVGYGTPVVSGDRVYQHARQGEEEVVWCLDLKKGETIWRKSYETPFKMGGGGERHGKGPKACPVLANGKLFTFSITGVLTAWDAESGERLWQKDYRKRFKKNHPYWGAASSPITDGKKVIAHLGNEKNGALTAFDGATGEEVWSQTDYGVAYSSPFVAEIDGVRQIVEWNHDALVGVDSKSGKLLWSFPFPQEQYNQNMPTPAFHKGRVLVGGENRGVRSVEPKLGSDGKWSAKENWHQTEVALDMSSAVVNGDLLFGMSHYKSGQLFCLDIATGKVLWKGPARVGQNVMFLSLPGHIMALTNKGQLKIIAANGNSHQELKSYRVASGDTWAPPVLLPDGVLVKDKDTLALWSFGP